MTILADMDQDSCSIATYSKYDPVYVQSAGSRRWPVLRPIGGRSAPSYRRQPVGEPELEVAPEVN
jgi:hypothetical protein